MLFISFNIHFYAVRARAVVVILFLLSLTNVHFGNLKIFFQQKANEPFNVRPHPGRQTVSTHSH